MEVGKRITYFRTKKGYSVNRLANLSGISQSYLRDVELGNKNPTVEILSYLCDALHITLCDFFNDQTQDRLDSSPLLSRIYQLTPAQQEAFLKLLDSLLAEDC